MMDVSSNRRDGEHEDLRARTKRFGLRVVRAYSALEKKDDVAQVPGRQMLRSGTSVGGRSIVRRAERDRRRSFPAR